MRRITVSIDESLVRLAKADVAAGRSESISAWVADAMRTKAQARADLIADLDEQNRVDPPDEATLAVVARSLGKTAKWTANALGVTRGRAKKAG